MMNDPIVEEIRETRRRIWEECNEDLDQLIARLKRGESMHKDRLVTLEQLEKRLTTPKGTH
jgi:hypothetical protein